MLTGRGAECQLGALIEILVSFTSSKSAAKWQLSRQK